jgi:biopolymer transport protein ExbD
MLRERLRSNRRICRIDFSAFVAVLVALATLLAWAMPMGYPGHGVSVYLPKAANAVELLGAHREDALLVSILRDGSVFFDTQRVYPDELPAKLQDRVRSGAPGKVYIKADGRVHYATVKDVLDSIGSAGLSYVAFVTDRKRG